MPRHRIDAAAEKFLHDGGRFRVEAMKPQLPLHRAASQHFAVDQHAVAVENDEIELSHRIRVAKVSNMTAPCADAVYTVHGMQGRRNA